MLDLILVVKRAFAVFDEIFSSTNIDDAVNILKILIHGLRKFPKSYFLIATHHPIKQLKIEELDYVSLLYVDTRIEKGIAQFTYQLKKGISELKLGLALFEQEGLLHLLK